MLQVFHLRLVKIGNVLFGWKFNNDETPEFLSTAIVSVNIDEFKVSKRINIIERSLLDVVIVCLKLFLRFKQIESFFANRYL